MKEKSSSILDGRIPKIILERIDIKKEFHPLSKKKVASAMNGCDGYNFAAVKVKEEFIADEDGMKETRAVDGCLSTDDSKICYTSQNVNQQSAISSRIVSGTITDSACCKSEKIKDPKNVTFKLISHLLEGALKEENENEFEDFFREHLKEVKCEKIDEDDENENQFVLSMDGELVGLKSEELSLDDFSLTEAEICANDAAVARCLAESSRRSGLRKNSKPRTYNYPYACDQCPDKFRYLKDFNKHLKEHSVISYAQSADINENQFFFPTYYERVGLKSEELNFVEFSLTESEICTNDTAVARRLAKSRHRSGLRKKLKQKTPNFSYACDQCCSKFRFLKDLNQHLKEHIDGTSHVSCSKIYKNNENKNQSTFSVNGVSPGFESEELNFDEISLTESEICSNDAAVALPLVESSYRSGLQKKVKLRTYNYPYACDHCPNKFRFLKDLNQHLRQHNNISHSFCARTDENDKKRNQCTISTNENSSSLECKELSFDNFSSTVSEFSADDAAPAQGLTESSSRIVLQKKLKPQTHNYPYACDQCSDKFCCLKDLNQHFEEHNDGVSHASTNSKSVGLENEEQSFDEFAVSKSEICGKNATVAFCLAESSRRNVLRHNLKARTYINPYACDQCPAKFRYLKQLNLHLKEHNGDISHVPCAKESGSKQNSNEEISIVTEKKSHCCTECPLKFHSLGGLRRHSNMHNNKEVGNGAVKPTKRHGKMTGEIIYSCAHCPFKSKWKTSFIRHLEIHSGDDKMFTCNVCHRQFRHRRSYLRHAMVHSAEKPFICPHCPAKMKAQRSYQNHIQRHLNNKPTRTNFASVSHVLKDPMKFLQGNVRDRSNDPSRKPFACKHCPSRFTQNADLVRHITDVHVSDWEYQCQVCPRTFFHLSSLKRHLQSHLDVDLHKCEFCPATFNEKRLLKSHLIMHFGGKWFMCAHCFSRFKQKSPLRVHLESCSGKPFSRKSCKSETISQPLSMVRVKKKHFLCAHCPRKFSAKSSLREHLSTYSHSDKRQHTCVHCSKKFWNKRMLKRHIQTHAMELPVDEQIIVKSFDEDTIVDVEL